MSESEHNFQNLNRLLKLKRHEVPPPGYFNNFSSEVIARIKAGESRAADSFIEQLKDRSPWLYNLVHIFDARPGLIGGLATSACLLLVFGVVMSQHDTNSGQGFAVGTQNSPVFASSTPAAAPESTTVAPSADPLASGGITVSTNPVTSLQPVATLFGQPGASSMFQPVSLTTGN